MNPIPQETQNFPVTALELMAASFILVVGVVALWAVVTFVVGISQTKQAIRHNVKNMQYEVGLIAHSCGIRNPRELRRFHAPVVQPNGLTVALSDQYPGRKAEPT